MNAQNFVKVTSVNGALQAISVQNTLETAGIPVIILASRDGTYLDVLVPGERVFDALGLLAPEVRCGEIFYVPAHVRAG
jgi:hypothetical protein